MNNEPASTTSESDDESGVSSFALASMVVRRRGLIMVLGFGGGLLGLALGLTSPRLYESTATFIPQASESGASGLALAAGQFGIRVPTGGGTWGPPVYVTLLHSWGLLEPIVHDTLTVVEDGGARIAVMDILRIKAPTEALRSAQAMRALSGAISATEDKKLNAVRVTVLTKWPSVSKGIADRLLSAVNTFNLETRKSQARAERQFVETQARNAEQALREVEDRLQSFLQQNRSIGGSADLAFQRDRLQRDVVLRQQMFSSLVQNREEAKIREVRDTPVISVLEEPRVPVVGKPRNSVQKGLLGGLVGGTLAMLFAFLVEAAAGARRRDSAEAREFFSLLNDATPRFVRILKRL